MTPDERPIRVKLRNYSSDQRDILRTLVTDLTAKGLVYANPSSPWASAPLLIPKPSPALWRFTVDFRPVNRYSIRNQFPMPYVDNELTKLASSKYYANLDFVH